MATSSNMPQATLAIPADYLEDAPAAFDTASYESGPTTMIRRGA